MRKTVSALALTAANLVPLYGVFFLGWSVANILILYWLENIVVGCYTVLKLAKANATKTIEPIKDRPVGGLFGRPVRVTVAGGTGGTAMTGFFIFHYGMFTFVHGILLAALLATGFGAGSLLRGFGSSDLLMLGIGTLALFVSHGVSYRVNFLGNREYERTDGGLIFWQPYPRMLVMHLAITGTAWLVGTVGSPLPLLVALIGGKIVIDLAGHFLEHRKFGDGRGDDRAERRPVPG